MITQKFLPALIGLSLAASLWSINASANMQLLGAQRCELGGTCTIPGNDGGQTYFFITPADGTDFTCSITPTSGQMVVYVRAGKDFEISGGHGIYTIEKPTQLRITGSFPPDKQEGQIKFAKIDGSDGVVTCSPTGQK